MAEVEVAAESACNLGFHSSFKGSKGPIWKYFKLVGMNCDISNLPSDYLFVLPTVLVYTVHSTSLIP